MEKRKGLALVQSARDIARTAGHSLSPTEAHRLLSAALHLVSNGFRPSGIRNHVIEIFEEAATQADREAAELQRRQR